MKRYLMTSVLVVAMLFAAGVIPVSKAESYQAKYDFDTVEVLYAAEFMAYPEGSAIPPSNVTASVYGNPDATGVTDAVYGSPGAIQVLYGVVKLGEGLVEQFIKVSDEEGSARALSNGMSNEYYDANYTQLRSSTTQFQLGKSLEGTSVVKNYTGKQGSILLTRKFDMFLNLTEYHISFQSMDQTDSLWNKWANTTYVVDMTSMRHKGKQAVY